MAKKRKHNGGAGFSVLRRGKRCLPRFKDHHGTWRMLPGCSDQDAAMEMARRLRQVAEYRAAGRPADEATLRWLDGLSDDVRERLIRA